MVDLHMHTRESDGTEDERELFQKLREAGVTVFSITDHDTIDAIRGMEYWVPEGMSYIRGIEFSCRTEIRNCHIIGYGFNKDVRAFGRMVERADEILRAIVQTHLDYLTKECGIRLDEDKCHSLVWCYRRNGWKSQLAKMLVDAGYAETESEAGERFIKPCPTNDMRPEAREAIQAILASGGIPVWAHPYGGAGKREMHGKEFEQQLQLLIEAGLQGIECYYSAYDEEQVESLLEVARKHNLLVSGGSDYHGKNKEVAMGTLNTYGKDVREEDLTILKELERRQKEHPYPLIEVEEWHNYGAAFWFMPVRVKNLEMNAQDMDNLDCLKEEEISISENSFKDFLYPLFKKHFDKELPENKMRWESYPPEHKRKYITWFEWYLTDNFYTFDGMSVVLAEIENIAAILEQDYDDSRLDNMRKGFRHLPDYMPEYWHLEKELSEEESDRIVRENKAYILDFYRRFMASIRAMIVAGEKAGYKLISVCGP